MIVLITDYGYQGPYVGQLKAKISEYSPMSTVIDLMHDVPAFNISAAAKLIPAISMNFPVDSVFICVVDPGVGSHRKAVLIKADSHYFIGPDNGLFDNLKTEYKSISQWEIMWRPKQLSSSFHGRDLFVPIACMLSKNELNFESDLKKYPLIELNSTLLDKQIIYFDNFGNAITSIKISDVNENNKLEIAGVRFCYARVFSNVNIGDSFWYKNSMGLVEIACNQKNIKEKYQLKIGQAIIIKSI